MMPITVSPAPGAWIKRGSTGFLEMVFEKMVKNPIKERYYIKVLSCRDCISGIVGFDEQYLSQRFSKNTVQEKSYNKNRTSVYC